MQARVIANVLLVTDDRRVLVLRRSEYKSRPELSHAPDLPGGIIESDETARDGVVRELLEETGIVIDETDARLAYTQTELHVDENLSVAKLMYVAKIGQVAEVKLSWEHEGFGWYKIDDLLGKEKFRPFPTIAIEYILANKLLA